LLTNRMMVDGVVETPNGAHFTSCVPDYGRDETFQRHYAKSAADEGLWPSFVDQFLSRGETGYQLAVQGMS
jgi:glutaconate CoA-transferase subunit A